MLLTEAYPAARRDLVRIAARGRSFWVDRGRNGEFWTHVDRGEWEPGTFDIFDRFIDRESAYLDLGAWIGPTVLYGCGLAKAVYAVEPDPIAGAELGRNLGLNRPLTENVHVYPLCLAPKSGTVWFGSEGEGGDSQSSLLFGKGKTRWTVEARNFEDLVGEAGIGRCGFIKMDIEGGEYGVLPGMLGYLRRHRPTAVPVAAPRLSGSGTGAGLGGESAAGVGQRGDDGVGIGAASLLPARVRRERAGGHTGRAVAARARISIDRGNGSRVATD